MKIAQCLSCFGRKTIVALGNMQKSCPQCHGIGFLEEPDKDLKVTLGDVIKIQNKRGRKKKSENILQC